MNWKCKGRNSYMFKNKGKIKEVEWLPGGCFQKKNLIKKTIGFKSDKAFCEDLFHSFHLQ